MEKLKASNFRRIMLEQKSKSLQAKSTCDKIISPVARYDRLGNLSCAICRILIKSSNVWKVHISSKHHKNNVEAAKQLKSNLDAFSSEKLFKHPDIKKKFREKKQHLIGKDILLHNNISEKTNHKLLEDNNLNYNNNCKIEDILPEKFFDDPITDAKIRNAEYKDVLDEEWERFQHEIKEESTMSNAIIAGEQHDAAIERQIKEINEQIEQWSRVIEMEERKEFTIDKIKKKFKTKSKFLDEYSSSDDSFDEFSNWRSKKFNSKQM